MPAQTFDRSHRLFAVPGVADPARSDERLELREALACGLDRPSRGLIG